MTKSLLPQAGLLANVQAVSLYSIASLLVLAAVYLIQNEVFRYSRRIKGLPGPQGWPIVGSLFEVRNQSVAVHNPLEVTDLSHECNLGIRSDTCGILQAMGSDLRPCVPSPAGQYDGRRGEHRRCGQKALRNKQEWHHVTTYILRFAQESEQSCCQHRYQPMG
jgi:hypothetical protein